MFDLFMNPRLAHIVSTAVKEAIAHSDSEAANAVRLAGDIVQLKQKLVDMEIQQAKKQEEWARREREIEHKIGLERKRQEFEIQQAKRETTVDVREKNLEADKERFKNEMDFQRTHLQDEITSLRELVSNMLRRLPSAEIYADLSKADKHDRIRVEHKER